MNENFAAAVVSVRAVRAASRLRRVIRWLIAASVFLVPLLSLPFTDDPRFIKPAHY